MKILCMLWIALALWVVCCLPMRASGNLFQLNPTECHKLGIDVSAHKYGQVEHFQISAKAPETRFSKWEGQLTIKNGTNDIASCAVKDRLTHQKNGRDIQVFEFEVAEPLLNSSRFWLTTGPTNNMSSYVSYEVRLSDFPVE